MTDGNYSHIVFHSSPLLSSTMILQRKRCWIKKVLTKQLYEGLCSRVDLSVVCRRSWEGDGVTGRRTFIHSLQRSCRLVEMCLDDRLVTVLLSKLDFVVPLWRGTYGVHERIIVRDTRAHFPLYHCIADALPLGISLKSHDCHHMSIAHTHSDTCPTRFYHSGTSLELSRMSPR